MPRNDGVRITSSSIKLPAPPPPARINPLDQLFEKTVQRFHSNCSTVLCSASLALSGNHNQDEERNLERRERVLISEVIVRNKDGLELERKDLEQEAISALKTCKPNSAISVREVEDDVHRIIGSGYFSSCLPVAVDSLDGVKLMFQVEPNQELQKLVCDGAKVLPANFVEDAFRDGYGKVLNTRHLNQVVNSINGWYKKRGLLGSVSGVEILSDGTVKLQVSETEVNNVSVRFLNKTGEPTVGKTRPEIILRELTTKKGQVYSTLEGRRDVQRVLNMGLMEDVRLVSQPAGDTGNVDLIMNVVERPRQWRDIISSQLSHGPQGLIGRLNFSLRNLFGRNEKANVSVQKGKFDTLFRLNYTDPWIEGFDKGTSGTILIENSKTPGMRVHGDQPDNANINIDRATGGIICSRPFRPNWRGTAGLFFQRAGARDDRGNPIIRDFYGSALTASGKTHDNMLLGKLESVYTGSGDSMLILNVEQGLPAWKEWLAFSRFTGRASKRYKVGPAVLHLSMSGGHVVGNFPPHDAFAIGGNDSVRGYEEGAIGSGRSYAVGSGEISFPVWNSVKGDAYAVEGVVFADYGTDFGSGSSVPGDPAGARLKRGKGYGYGAGIRVHTPIGPLRLEYALNDQRTGKFHFGLGLRP